MTTMRKKRPRDPAQLGKLIVDIATGQTLDTEDDGNNAAAAKLGLKGGGTDGGTATEIARRAAMKRWS